MLLFCTIMADLQVCAAVYIVNVCDSKVWFHLSRILALIELREPHDCRINGSRHLPSNAVHTHSGINISRSYIQHSTPREDKPSVAVGNRKPERISRRVISMAIFLLRSQRCCSPSVFFFLLGAG
ncbi:hypothetical protein V8C43DRAFT_272509 [Trichoderma afarasin]